jgi:hypothetical protein
MSKRTLGDKFPKPTKPRDGYDPFEGRKGPQEWDADEAEPITLEGEAMDDKTEVSTAKEDPSDSRWLKGETRDTPELHNVMCIDCKPRCDGKWCVKGTDLEVRTPNGYWNFRESKKYVRIKCVKNNQKSWEWNVYPNGPRYEILHQNVDKIVVRLFTGSRSVKVRVEGYADFYAPIVKTGN